MERIKKNINYGWTFKMGNEEKIVDFPHTPVILHKNYFQEKETFLEWTYSKHFSAAETDFKNKNVSVVFGAISNKAVLKINGKKVSECNAPYLPFETDITEFSGKDIDLVLECNSCEDPLIPPFGNLVDYLVYCGAYREAYISAVDKKRFENVRFEAKADRTLSAFVFPTEKCNAILSLSDLNGNVLYSSCSVSVEKGSKIFLSCPEVRLWSIDEPVLYEARVETDTDCFSTLVGFRDCRFHEDGFYLNGKRIKLIGLDRHQSYAHVGYAMPGSFQREDARFLKSLGLNIVRTSHYPQHPDFLDECDKLGLLVFEEIPGWQHISENPVWRNRVLENTTKMVLRDWNHPSIILWGVRINESKDDDELYSKTNEIVHNLDPLRQTGGVRNFVHSHLLEDVYTFNDFINEGQGKGLRDKSEVLNIKAPLLVTEYMGHMYPVKTYDCEDVQTEHALRCAKTLDDMMNSEGISGCIGWCMSDYNTHSTFGNGDLICHHGMSDIFRNPKPAAFLYMSQQDITPVFACTSLMERGEHPALGLGKSVIFTNADSVRITLKEKSSSAEYCIGTFKPDRNQYKGLAHPPIVLTWQIPWGILVSTPLKNFEKQRREIAEIAYESSLHSFNFFESYEAQFKRISDETGLTVKELKDYCQKAPAVNFKGKAVWTFETIKNSRISGKYVLDQSEELVLNIDVSKTDFSLSQEPTYQVAQVKLKATRGSYPMPMPFCFEPFTVKTSGSIELYGSPSLISMEGGYASFYVRTKGKTGEGHVTVLSNRWPERTIDFSVTD